MMYKSSFVAAIKVDGKILRENGESVCLPFGSEYSIYMKNLNPSQRAVINISIDGQNITNNGLVLGAGASSELERPLNDPRRFKFIERTADIESHRGIGSEDGIVQVNFQFEADPITLVYDEIARIYNSYNHKRRYGRDVYYCSRRELGNSPLFTDDDDTRSLSVNSVGITGKGTVSSQQFESTSIGNLEKTTHTILFHLTGYNHKEVVSAPVTVRTRKFCSLCGRSYSSSANFCESDGNALDVV